MFIYFRPANQQTWVMKSDNICFVQNLEHNLSLYYNIYLSYKDVSLD
jgi:hypothetical protein